MVKAAGALDFSRIDDFAAIVDDLEGVCVRLGTSFRGDAHQLADTLQFLRRVVACFSGGSGG